MIDKSFIPLRSEKTASRIVGEEAVVLILDKQESMVLNDTGAFIWQNSDGKKNAGQIASSLAIDFDVPENVALNDCLEFINKMIAKEALVISTL